MSKLLKKKQILSLILVVTMILSVLAPIVSAVQIDDVIDTTRKASLTIVKYENAYGEGKNPDENVPLKDVTFTIYKLDDVNHDRTAEDIYNDIKAGTITLTSIEAITNEEGLAEFKDLDLGRYLVVESKVPTNVSVAISPFLVDLPRTSDDGQSWNYDVTVYPKNETVYGQVTLTKLDEEGNVLPGTEWELQKKTEDKYVKYNYEGTLVTNDEGKISINNLPVGDYRLLETKTVSDDYILDQSNVQEFTITKDNTNFEFTVTNEKSGIEKEVKTSLGYGEHLSAYSTDTVEWRITVDVPSVIEKMDTYFVTDTLPEGLDYVDNTLEIYAVNDEGETKLEEDTNYTFTLQNGTFKVIFNTESLKEYNSVYFTYDTEFNENVSYGKAEENSATLTYTNKIGVDGEELSTYTTDPNTAEVHTGEVLIKKVDEEGNLLAGAKFKIATTENNAENGIYVKGSDGEDLVAVSNENGEVRFSGLKYGLEINPANEGESQYYIVEIESPTYVENGETKHYNLLSKPVEVTVNSTSGEEGEGTVTVVNKKGFVLPLTGGTGAFGLIVLGISLIGIAIKLNKKEEK